MRLLHIIISGAIIIGAPAIVTAIGLRVGARVEHVEQLKRQIRDDNERSRLLAIELANLERPDHVQQLADQLHLGLQMPTSQQYLVAASELPMRTPSPDAPPSVVLTAERVVPVHVAQAPAMAFAISYSNGRASNASVAFAAARDNEQPRAQLLP